MIPGIVAFRAGFHLDRLRSDGRERRVVVSPPRPPTEFAVPAGSPSDVLRQLDDQALGAARARVAAKLGNPDPYALRAWLADHRASGAATDASPGRALTPDSADAALVSAALSAGTDARACGLVGLFAGRPPGPAVRAVPVDSPAADWLRFPQGEPPPPHRWGKLESWSCADIGDEAMATVRCAEPIPGGVALGSDYGLTLWRGGKFERFPWPAGARREARRVEAMAVFNGELVVATSQSMVTWNFRSEPTIRKHRPDAEGGWDEVRALLPAGNRLLTAWRTGLEGASGPAEIFSLANAGNVTYAGTGSGDVHVVNGGRVRALTEGGRHAVRHLAFADGILHAAAGGKHYLFDGANWSASAPEPTAFSVDRVGRLWLLAEGRVFGFRRGGSVSVSAEVERPWCLAASAGRLWIGGKERVWSLGIE